MAAGMSPPSIALASTVRWLARVGIRPRHGQRAREEDTRPGTGCRGPSRWPTNPMPSCCPRLPAWCQSSARWRRPWVCPAEHFP
jgi:hypothetical protein